MKLFELRSASDIMTLEHLGCLYPTCLSFTRRLIRKLQKSIQHIECYEFAIDTNGYGHAVYTVLIDNLHYSLIVFANEIHDDERTDRVIAQKWDTSFVLFDGIPTDDDIIRLSHNVPKQEKGRYTEKELILSRANKSVRMFYHVIEKLSQGVQPDENEIKKIGYLLRTSAVYGNGKFGIADRQCIKDRAFFKAPFQLELLTVWLIRHFSFELVEHLAQCRNPILYTPLDKRIKRFLGIGNSTGLGMAPFLVNHPILLNNWILAKEKSLLKIREQKQASYIEYQEFYSYLTKSSQHLAQWIVEDERQKSRLDILKKEIPNLVLKLNDLSFKQPYFWNMIYETTLDFSLECQELVIALLFETHSHLINDFAEEMSQETYHSIDTSMKISTLQKLIHHYYDFALHIDFHQKNNTALFWYVSEEKLEPRIGKRHIEEGQELELPLDIAHQVNKLSHCLKTKNQTECVADILQECPQYRHIIERIQNAESYPYSEIHDNLIANTCLPIDMLRAKLSFFGASKFDPKSDKWTRIALFQGAPLTDEIHTYDEKKAFLPVL